MREVDGLDKYDNEEDDVDEEADENVGVKLAEEEIDDARDDDDVIELFLISEFPLFGFFKALSLFCFLHLALLFLNQTF